VRKRGLSEWVQILIKKKREINPMTQDQKRRPKNTKTGKEIEGKKAVDTSGLCA